MILSWEMVARFLYRLFAADWNSGLLLFDWEVEKCSMLMLPTKGHWHFQKTVWKDCTRTTGKHAKQAQENELYNGVSASLPLWWVPALLIGWLVHIKWHLVKLWAVAIKLDFIHHEFALCWLINILIYKSISSVEQIVKGNRRDMASRLASDSYGMKQVTHIYCVAVLPLVFLIWHTMKLPPAQESWAIT